MNSPLVKLTGTNACPTVTATPATVKAAFTKENNVFAEINVKYIDPILNFADKKLFAFQMYDALKGLLGLSEAENDRAIEAGHQGAHGLRNEYSQARGKFSINSNATFVSAS